MKYLHPGSCLMTNYGSNTLKTVTGELSQSDATHLGYVFSECSNLTEIDADLFKNCTKVYNINCTFRNCTSLTSIPSGLFDNMSVLYAELTFYDCVSLIAIPDGLFNSNRLCYADNLFYNCTSLVAIPHDLICSSSNLSIATSMFEYCLLLRQICYNLFLVVLWTHNLCNIIGGNTSLSYLERVFLWNMTSSGLTTMNSYYNYIPTTTVSGGGTVFIGKTITDDDRFSGALTGSDGQTFADSTLVAQLLTMGYNRVYVGQCELGSHEFQSSGYIETAGTFVSNVETITIPTVDEITATVSAQIQAMSAEERAAYEQTIADGIATAKAEMEAREATL